MAKELDNKKMWECLIKRSKHIGINWFSHAIEDALKEQGFKFDDENIVPIEKEFKIDIDQLTEESANDPCEKLRHSEPTKKSDQEELNEFEKAVKQLMEIVSVYGNPELVDVEDVKQRSKCLLSIARKQFVNELPKWEKCTLPDYHCGWSMNSDYLINPKGDYIKLSEIENVFENNYE